jgi:signal transduction histidine kinase
MTEAASFSLSRKLGALALGMVALLAVVCAVVVYQLDSMRTDARRLVEESRELTLTKDLDVHLESIDAFLQMRRRDPTDEAVKALLTRQLEDVRAILAQMASGPSGPDPSREQHQEDELAITATLEQQLEILERRVPRAEALDSAEHTRVAGMRDLGHELDEEASEETEHAAEDLEARSRNAVRIMIGTLIAATVGLGLTLFVAFRSLVVPLHALRTRAEAVGAGRFEPGPRIESRDEIGQLARAFDEMARRVAATQEDLENRVAARTRELVRAARYADLGILAAGVAHEINNPLASIASCAEGLMRRVERGSLQPGEQEDYLKTIASEAYRARDITQRLLSLARHDPGPTTRINLRDLLGEVERIVRDQVEKHDLELHVAVIGDPAIHGNRAELLQALVNLTFNARDAARAEVRVSASGGDGVVFLDVDDDGPGVPEELRERIFEPFFTTKPAGEGTGLGLALVAAIVDGHRGHVEIQRAPSGGARFRVRLPAAAGGRA